MRRAYTLIEILVVIAVMGIAGAMVIPAMGSAGVLRIQAAVRSVVADITYAQADALAFQETRAIVFSEAENRYSLVGVPGGEISDQNTLYLLRGPGQRYVVDLDAPNMGGARIANASFDGNGILIFDPLGGPVAAPGSDAPGAGGSVDLVGPMSSFRIHVAPFTGRVTVEQLRAEGPETPPGE